MAETCRQINKTNKNKSCDSFLKPISSSTFSRLSLWIYKMRKRMTAKDWWRRNVLVFLNYSAMNELREAPGQLVTPLRFELRTRCS